MNRLLQGFTFGFIVVFSSVISADFEPEEMGIIETLPQPYPDHWIMAQDLSFFHMLEGAVRVIDPSAETIGGQYKGQMTSSFIGVFKHSQKRNEHYVIESFHSRGGRGGERTDFVTIYDPSSLSVADEIEIPPKRVTSMPKRTQAALLGKDERFIGVYNFTPAQSVSIVDLEKRVFVEEIATEGCGFVIPNGKLSFTSICANGSFLTTDLDKSGAFKSSERTDIIFDSIEDPIFEAPAIKNGTAYFLTYSGKVMPIDISKNRISVGQTWPLATNDEEMSWRPGGITNMASDSEGYVYVLMHPEGGEGTHKNPGNEVWVYDLKNKQRISRIAIKNWGLVVGTSGSDKNKFLLVTNTDMAIDVYGLPGGEYVRSLTSAGSTPFVIDGLH